MPVKPGDAIPQDAVIGQKDAVIGQNIPEGSHIGDEAAETPHVPAPFETFPRLMQPGSESGLLNKGIEAVKGGINALTAPLTNPRQFVTALGQPSLVGHTPSGYPAVAPTGSQARDEQNEALRTNMQSSALQEGKEMLTEHPAYLAGSIAAPLIAGRAVAGRISPPELTPEMQSRGITRAINVPPEERPQMMRNLQSQAGNIMDYAKREGLPPVRSGLDFASAARGAGEETSNFFKNEVLAPIANEHVDVMGTSSFPNRTTASLGEVEGKISKLNAQILPDYVKKNTALSREALANDSDLVAERDRLNNILYKTVAEKYGWSPEQVKELRQRYGSLYDIADRTNAAVNARERGVDVASEGRGNLPMSKLQMLSEGAAKLFNLDPESIANRRLTRALGRLTIEPTELPPITPRGNR